MSRHLSLSTNNVEKMAALNGLPKLKVLSLGRNQIKKLESLDGVAETLQELWISYNLLEKLAGIEKLVNLRVLWMSNNKVKDWAELDRLAANVRLEELLLIGNPLNPTPGSPEYRIEILKRLPGLKKLDGVPVDPEEREAAKAA
ncbi:Dynein light chain 1, axonemal [Coccomyxa sp. Obi]|nr:Dynein light chain 1, axonemal [Coccomyxa sp. Obi]